MTNNPTIDGVSRATIEAILKDGSCKPEVNDAYRAARKELRALLDAPAVERQEPTIKRFNTSVSHDGSYEHVVLEEHRSGHVMRSNDVVEYVAALQSTIARLEARIAELESGRGEPVAWPDLEKVSNGMAYATNAKINERQSALFTAPPAPVSVVLPELESAFEKWWEEDGQYCRCGGGSYEKTFAYRAYEACLDATAALNGSVK